MKKQNSPRPPVALVLGAAVWDDGIPSPTLRRRAMHAAQLYLAGQIGHIIGCGGIGLNPPTEASIIRDICVEQGVPKAAISLEDRSINTLQNVAYARAFLKRLDAKSVLLVTDRSHSLRARLIAKHFGLSARVSIPNNKSLTPYRALKSYVREVPALALFFLRIMRR